MRGMILAGAMLAATAPAFANDTTAELTTGGLTYVQTSEVAMEEENLYISREEVLVDYVFRNTGDKDVESVIAFPMPDIVGGSQGEIAYGDQEADNFLGFSVVQDGRQIKPELQQRVYAAGVDRTDELKAQHISFLPYSEKIADQLKALPDNIKQQWLAEGLIYADVYSADAGQQPEMAAAWTLKSVYWWKTKFPAGKPIKVSHRYKPSVGGTVAMTFIDQGKPGPNYDDYVGRYCIDQSFMKTAAKLEAAAGKSGPNYTEQWVSYVLTTGANWGGSMIGKFTLTIDKGRAQDYVSFCGDGVKKVGPTTFEMSTTDFTPQKDLHILFVTAAE